MFICKVCYCKTVVYSSRQSNRNIQICNIFQLFILHFQILTELLQFMMQPMAVIFCGHLGKAELDAVAIANSVSLKLFQPKVTLNNFWSHKPYCKGHTRYLFKISDRTKFRTSMRTIRIQFQFPVADLGGARDLFYMI